MKGLTLFALFVSLASATPVDLAERAARVTSIRETTTYCQTASAATPTKKVPTTSKTTTHSFTFTHTKTVRPTTTITPATPTTTSPTTTTTTATNTAPQTTDTTTTTTTSTSTTTTTITNTDTETDTATSTVSTTSSGTSTISTVAGFTPVASEASVVSNGGGTQYPSMKKRNTSVNKAATVLKNPALAKNCKARYPSKVTCYKVVNVFSITTTTVTKGKTSTVFAPTPTTSTVITTITSTATTTVTPADTTETDTATDTETETDTATTDTTTTTTTTSTTTSTSFVAIATQYAACQSNNLIDAVGGTELVDFNRPPAGSFVGTSDTTAEACCVSCQTANGCVGFGFSISGFDFGCLLIEDTADTCDPSQSSWQFFNDAASGQVVVGNGNCGQGTYTN